ncbi:hypothetical protein A3A05_00010 [Candidatus Nomurabacteria bacterium RIFCSPLOWO2_01_FULL_41_12]|uniref:Uncharacterized protein n=1 Tax=Candidatus Nomurabacteria bacterium RIFCSPLOWO2_01_FULL_41_12 TaxID=1801774 RepID=A0A1F6WXA4_9BACT|nr:MAG: hypothetical protein A3A05_00010 [Candidatus Nomurabacteria bacterium RIFCSPLOWO2_01_FULL_41_12]
MKKDNFVLLASWIFLIVGVAHIVRLLYGWQVQMGDVMVPMWIYWAEALASLYLAYLGFQFSKKA